jgi:(2R)-3-sulfolactate dehydrogenase (NADP+)
MDVYFDRVEALIDQMQADAGVRLPGDRRHAARRDAAERGVELSQSMYAQLAALAAPVT